MKQTYAKDDDMWAQGIQAQGKQLICFVTIKI